MTVKKELKVVLLFSFSHNVRFAKSILLVFIFLKIKIFFSFNLRLNYKLKDLVYIYCNDVGTRPVPGEVRLVTGRDTQLPSEIPQVHEFT